MNDDPARLPAAPLSNQSVGSFTTTKEGNYKVIFGAETATNSVYYDTAAIINKQMQTVASTYPFAGEDGSDGDYNDVFVTLSTSMRAG